MIRYDVPFVENPDNRCVPATIAMVVQYFMPERHVTLSDSEKLCGYAPGKANWPILSMIALHDLGFELKWIEDFDLPAFSRGPEDYLRRILKDPKALDYQITKGDLPLEARRAKQYLDAGLPFEKRAATKKDIKQLLETGWLVRLEVNARSLAGKKGYIGHSVLVVGFDGDEYIIHNPDGQEGNRPNLRVSWPLLEKAWREFGGSYSLYAFKKEKR